MSRSFVVVLALTVLAAAVEAKIKTKKRGLEEFLAYGQHNQLFPLGGPIELGSLYGLEAKGLEALGSGLAGLSGYGFTSIGDHNLNLFSDGLQDYSLPLQNIGHYTVQSAALLGNGGLYSSASFPHGYASGYGLGSGTSIQSPVAVSVPHAVASTPAITQSPQSQSRAQSPNLAQHASSAPPAQPASAPPTAFPPTDVPIPIAAQPPAPLTVPGPAVPSAPIQLSSPSQAQSSHPAFQLPQPAPLPQVQAAPQPQGGRLGSGSLGYTDFGNGVIALGSGSLGYTHSASANTQQPQQQIQISQFAQSIPLIQGLIAASQLDLPQQVQLGQPANPPQLIQISQQNHQYGSLQSLPLDQTYGSLSTLGQASQNPQQQQQQQQQQQSPVYTRIQTLPFNQEYAEIPQGSFGEQGGDSNAGYGGYSLSGSRASTLEHLNSNPQLASGDNNLLGSGSGGY